MKRLLALLVAGCLAVSFAGCSSAKPRESDAMAIGSGVASKDQPVTVSPSEAPQSMRAIALPSVKEAVTADDGTTLFTLSFPQAQVILGDSSLEERIIGDLQTRNGSVLTEASQLEAQANLDYPESEFWSEYFIDISYTPTRLDDAVLSLFGNFLSYSGGPHPSLTTDSVTYDLETGAVMYLDYVLAPECTPDTLYQLVLQSLSGQAEDLYYDYADALGDRFTGELHSIQDWYFSRSGLCFHFAPYDIAPYSSGTIIAELPYGNLKGILKDKYFPAEASLATGSMYVEDYQEESIGRFSCIANVPLSEDGIEVLLYPDAVVTDLRIETGWRYADTDQYISGATVFAASNMGVGDAISLTADLASDETLLRLVYHADGKEYSAFITYDASGDTIVLSNG
jgi:hypothetical protein